MTLAPRDPVTEVKRNLDGTVVRYDCRPLVIVPRSRAVVSYELSRSERVGRDLLLPSGTRSYGYYSIAKPYILYHWRYRGATLAFYINVGRVRSVSEREIVWDDYAVDVLVHPDGAVEVLDEEELLEATDSLRRYVERTKDAAVRRAREITTAIAAMTALLERGETPARPSSRPGR